jgi:hypothetical protein
MSALEPEVPPDERAFIEDAGKPSFLAGVHRGHWTIEKVAWPNVDISVSAAPRPGAPERYWLRCDLTNFPADAPTATPWDPNTNAKLVASGRPKGHGPGLVFRSDWEEGRALYAAYDRVALAGHANWMSEHPRSAWNGTQDLTWWVMRIWELLNDDDYLGI